MEQPVVLAETANWIVINKPAHWLSIAGSRPESVGTQADGQNRGGRPVLVDWARRLYGPLWVTHRLDVQTSGVILFARTARDHALACGWFENRIVKKQYWCLVSGCPVPHLKLNVPIGGKRSVTQIEVPQSFKGASCALALVRPLTGRRHQIRIHLSGAGYPLWGDLKYGGRVQHSVGAQTLEIPRVALHASQLTLPSGESFEAPMPLDMNLWIQILKDHEQISQKGLES